jgi:hypothetical protein
VALIPVCKRERAAAASQAVVTGCVASAGVDADSITGVPVDVGSGVREAASAVGFVSAEEGTGVGLGVSASVVVGEVKESVSVDSIVGVS